MQQREPSWTRPDSGTRTISRFGPLRKAEVDPFLLIRLVAEHFGVDLDVLILLDDCRPDFVTSELESDLDLLVDVLDTDGSLPAGVDARSKTLRRIALARHAAAVPCD